MIRIGCTLLFSLLLEACVITGPTADMPVEQRKKAVQSSIALHVPELRKCYEDLLRDPAISEGKVVLQWDIDAQGTAQNIAFDQPGSNLTNSDLNSCLMKIVSTTQFPPTSDGTDVHIRYPFVFSRVR